MPHAEIPKRAKIAHGVAVRYLWAFRVCENYANVISCGRLLKTNKEKLHDINKREREEERIKAIKQKVDSKE